MVKDGKAVMTPVKTGISDFQNIEILSGVPAGAQVVSGPFRAVAKTLKDGAVVDIKDAKSLNKEALKEEPEEGISLTPNSASLIRRGVCVMRGWDGAGTGSGLSCFSAKIVIALRLLQLMT